ncbi:arylesterase [Haematobacter massiliensis]|uniref:arylesterase n=1 Tax=Haematobacter massiliensis TaxID=195105 RepID=UPI000A04E51D|nr:arylesterase [Haematobacter massiliensis]OWJ74198.1 arylesterase [Haematobacter massiliensis]OWJ83957.1 arylesterase [Haematobacter massiliensis]QBJ23298.1 arylesterase [Haematobacter massiliensis]
MTDPLPPRPAPARKVSGVTAAVLGLLFLCLGLLVAPSAEARSLRVVAFGDSLMQSFGLPAQQSLPVQLEAWLRARGWDVRVENAGIAGDSTRGGRARLERVLRPRPDAMIVSLGGNDAFRGVPFDTAAANLTAIMGEIRARAIPALLVGVEIPGIYAPALRYNRLWSEVAAAQEVPLYPNFYLGILRHLSTPFEAPRYLLDGIHPNAEGVTLIVEALGPAVEAILPR